MPRHAPLCLGLEVKTDQEMEHQSNKDGDLRDDVARPKLLRSFNS